MPGFYAHVPASYGAYTALPMVAGTGILDSIVNDIGAGVNGWTVYDDQRSAGTGTTMIVNVMNAGMYQNSINTISNSYTAISGNGIAVGDTSVGYNWAYSISGQASAPTDISWDGTNWYTAYYSAWPTNKVTATLDRNFAQATSFTNKLKTRCRSYIVLQCSSSIKTFYVQLGLKTGNPGGPLLYTQPYETWVTATHTGTVPGQLECLWAYWAGVVANDVQVQYVLALYSEAMFLWVNGATTAYGQNTTMPTSMYVGNLDTTPFRSGTDSGALWAGWSCTAYSGLTVSKGHPYNQGWQQWGNGMCLRTRGGSPWVPVTDYHVPQPNVHVTPFVYYQFVPRGRTYLEFTPGSSINTSGKALLSTVDIYAGGISGPVTTYFATNNEGPPTYEGVRGELRYLKVPVTSPAGQHMRTWGPMQDGRSYIILRHGPVYWAGNATWGQVSLEAGSTINIPSSFARIIGPGTANANRPVGDVWMGVATGPSAGAWYRFLAIPVL